MGAPASGEDLGLYLGLDLEVSLGLPQQFLAQKV
jgi:hypothetical protein